MFYFYFLFFFQMLLMRVKIGITILENSQCLLKLNITEHCVCVLSRYSRVWLFVTLWTIRSSVHETFHAWILQWVAITSSRGSSRPRDWICVFHVSCIAGRFFTTEPPGKPQTGSGSVQKRLVKRTGGFLLSKGEMGQDRLDPETESGPGTGKEWRICCRISSQASPRNFLAPKGNKNQIKKQLSP